ncbi:MAG: cytochrome c-type biogenesis protein [Pseudomonadota bacterium]
MALVTVAHAVEPDEMLDDPALEERAQEIDEQLRCVVCQSQSIAESNAPLAKDLRVLVRERLSDGDTNAQAIDYIVERYGDYVLLKPPVQPNTYFLWVFPALVLLIGGVIAVLALRRAGAAHAATPLSPDEEAALERLRQEQE